MSSKHAHEEFELLSEDTENLYRANVSLREELEAVDWYQQRAEACADLDLQAVLLHNKNEEIERAMMTLDWLRRKDELFAASFARYLSVCGPIFELESPSSDELAATSSPARGIGSLKLAK